MTKPVYYFRHLKDTTVQELKEKEATHRKNAREATETAARETALADDLLREQNFRRIPEAQETYNQLKNIRMLLKKHEDGTAVVSKTRLTKLKRAEELLEKSLNAVLLYGGYLHRFQTEELKEE